MKRSPTFRSAIWNQGPIASADMASIAAVTEISGANQKIILSASSGMMSSLLKSFSASAIDCSNPCGPTRMGPSRACMSAMTFRSIKTMYPATSGRTATMMTAQTRGTQMEITKWRRFIIMALPVDFSQYDIERTDDGHDVRHQVPANHLVKGLKINQGRRANPHAVRLSCTVANNVIAELALGRFNRVINLARRRLQHLADLPHDGPGRNIFDGLQADQPRLAHFFHPDNVPVVGIAILADGDFKFVQVVRGVRHRLADVPFHAARTKHRAGSAVIDRFLGGEDANALGASHP